mmetsp:Transcript_13125/g.48696  ORF Transcript_13125/g.48696 Transcript_13125/m.48696 type:complete len:261 (-) Transcript_13125:234-1016(-)
MRDHQAPVGHAMPHALLEHVREAQHLVLRLPEGERHHGAHDVEEEGDAEQRSDLANHLLREAPRLRVGVHAVQRVDGPHRRQEHEASALEIQERPVHPVRLIADDIAEDPRRRAASKADVLGGQDRRRDTHVVPHPQVPGEQQVRLGPRVRGHMLDVAVPPQPPQLLVVRPNARVAVRPALVRDHELDHVRVPPRDVFRHADIRVARAEPKMQVDQRGQHAEASEKQHEHADDALLRRESGGDCADAVGMKSKEDLLHAK